MIDATIAGDWGSATVERLARGRGVADVFYWDEAVERKSRLCRGSGQSGQANPELIGRRLAGSSRSRKRRSVVDGNAVILRIVASHDAKLQP